MLFAFLDMEHGSIIEFLEGALGDCWLLGAMATFSEKLELFEVLLCILTTQHNIYLIYKECCPCKSNLRDWKRIHRGLLIPFLEIWEMD